MKKIIIILFILVMSICLIPVNAVEKLKSIEYEAIINDPAGIDVTGTYKDENNVEKQITKNIPYNSKVNVLYEYFLDNKLYGHIKYATTITVKVEDTSRNSTNVNPDEKSNDKISDKDIKPSENKKNEDVSETITKKYIEKENPIEIEADIDLSKCRVDNEFSLDHAIKLNEKRKVMIVNKEGIELYKGPALGYGKLSYVIPALTELEYSLGSVNLTEDNSNVAWAYIEKDNYKGWLLLNDVANYKKGRLLSFGKVTIREYPKDESKALKTLPAYLRKSFTYLYDSNNKWYYINYKGVKGWVKNVATGINAEIKIKKDTKLYEKPNLEIPMENVTIPKGTKLKSIYKYSKDKEAFYVKYKDKTGWIILDESDPDFEVNYLDDNVKDKLLDKDKTIEKKETKNNKSGIKPIYIFLGILGLIIIVVIIIMIIKKKRRQSNNFTVHEEDINSSKPKITLINRSRMGR